MSLWIELPIALLLLASGALSLIAALGLLRLPDFFQRMHPPALAYTLATWCVALASVLDATALGGRLALHAWVVVVLLSITTPVTTLLLARAALFRQRIDGVAELPPRLGRRHADVRVERHTDP